MRRRVTEDAKEYAEIRSLRVKIQGRLYYAVEPIVVWCDVDGSLRVVGRKEGGVAAIPSHGVLVGAYTAAPALEQLLEDVRETRAAVRGVQERIANAVREDGQV